jgi:hypothetical protein
MSTSGSTDFTMTRDQIIEAAALEVGDIAMGDTLGPDLAAKYALRLNSWVKALMADGARLWALRTATLFLVPGTAQYALGPTGAHCSNSYVQSALGANALVGASTVSLSTFAGMTAGDNIGILLDSGTLFWTTISGAPGATTTLAAPLSGAASSGAVVFTYTSKIGRPQRVVDDTAYWRSPSTQDTPIIMFSRSDYAERTNKTTRGKVVQAYYDPQLGNGQLYLWPAPDSATDVLRFSYERVLEDFDSGGNTPDFPIEWGEALILGLAHRMAPSAGLSLAERQDLERRAGHALAIAEDYDRENTPIFFQPDMRC